MLLYTRVARPKTPKRRSRAGCTFCKEKKKKCDEGRPKCNRCVQRGYECGYEPVKPRQRRKRSPTDPGRSTSARRDEATGPAPPEQEATGGRSRFDYGEDGRSPSPGGHYIHEVFDNAGLCVSSALSPISTTFYSAPLTAPFLEGADVPALSPTSTLSYEIVFRQQEEDEASDTAWMGGAARRLDASDVAGPATAAWTGSSRSTSLRPDLAMIAPCPTGSPLLEFRVPAFREFSESPDQRALVAHFCNILSHLIVFREESGNPFQQLVLPLTRNSSPVLHAIYALASAHLEYRRLESSETSLRYHSKAIQGLTNLIALDHKAKRNEILATIMLLVYYEVLVQKGRSNIVDGHLKGALTVILSNPESSDDPTSNFLERAFRFYDVIAALSNGTPPLSAAPAAGCLQPVPPLGAPRISPLSNVDTLLGMATTLWPVIHRLSCLPSLKAELERAVRADPLSCKVTVLRTEFEASVEAIETALLAWQPNLPSNFFPDGSTHRDFETLTLAASCRASEANTPSPACASPSCGPSAPCPASHPPHAHIPDRHGLHSILHNAMAYRHSALVYLYRNIHGLGRRHAAVQQHAHAALAHCEATVRARGPMGALLWPLFVAACEAVTDVDRDLAGAAFEGIERRQGMLNIGRAWEIVVEVWRRADAADGEGAEEETGVLTSGGDDPLQSGDGRDPSVQTQEALVGLRQASDDEEGDARLAARGDGRQLDGAGSFESQGMPSGGVSHAGSAPRGHGGPGMRAAAAKPRRAGRGADLWRLVSQDMGVHIVFG